MFYIQDYILDCILCCVCVCVCVCVCLLRDIVEHFGREVLSPHCTWDGTSCASGGTGRRLDGSARISRWDVLGWDGPHVFHGGMVLRWDGPHVFHCGMGTSRPIPSPFERESRPTVSRACPWYLPRWRTEHNVCLLGLVLTEIFRWSCRLELELGMGLDFGQSAPPRSERSSAAEIPRGAGVAENSPTAFVPQSR